VLLGAGADPNAAAADGTTALHLAASFNRAGMVKQLVAAGALVDARQNGTDATPLHLAAGWGSPDVVQALVDAGARVDARTGGNLHTALHIAAGYGRPKMVQPLLAARVDPYAVNRQGMTAAGLAWKYGHRAVIVALQGARIDVCASRRGSPGSRAPVVAARSHGCGCTIN
jgi:uncharacterized protein